MANIFDFGLQNYTLRLSGLYRSDSVFAVVGDTARRLEVQVLDSTGVVRDTSGLSLRLSTEVGGQATYVDADAIDASKGLYSIDLTNGMLLKPGKQEFQWTVTDASGNKIHSSPFTGVVAKNITEGGSQSYNFYLSYDELKDNIKEVKDMQKDLIDGTVDSAAIQQNVEERYGQLEEEYAQNLSEVTAQLAQTKPKIPYNLLRKVKKVVVPPKRFIWDGEPINIYRDADGGVSTDFDVFSLAHVGQGKIYYVDVKNGNDDNNGLSPQTALKTITAALTKNDVDIIELASGYYDDEHGFDGNRLGLQGYKDITIRAEEDAEVIISTARRLNWVKDPDWSDVYRQRRTLIKSVYDASNIDDDGDYIALTKVSSAQEVDETPNSYFYDGDLILVHTFNSRPADENILPFLNIKNFHTSGSHKVYFENLKIYGGNEGAVNISATSTTDKPILAAKNCEFKYSSGGNGGLTSLGADTYLDNCIASLNYKDGLNYHIRSERTPTAVEINCKGFKNGLDESSYQDNGSTMHDGGKIIRINCDYYENRGPNCHDVNEGTQSWNLGTQAHESTANVSTRVAGFQIESGEMWLDTCVAYDSPMAYRVPNGRLNLRNSLFEGEESVINTGVVQEY